MLSDPGKSGVIGFLVKTRYSTPLHLAFVDSLSLGVVQCQVGPYQPAIINTLTRMAALHVQELSMHVCSHLSHPNIYSFDSSPSLQAFRPTSYQREEAYDCQPAEKSQLRRL